MASIPHSHGRRTFLSDAVLLGATALVGGASISSAKAQSASPGSSPQNGKRSTNLPQVNDTPTSVWVDHGKALTKAERRNDRFNTPQAEVTLSRSQTGTSVRIACPKAPIARVLLRWESAYPADVLFLGDHWERGYGDLQWRFLQPERVMPWYFAAHLPSSAQTVLTGVMTQAAALCFWTVDASGISLWLDLRNGGSPSMPGDREIEAAAIVTLASNQGETPFSALRRFCQTMCPKPRVSAAPICGNNNWYYAYGRNFDAEAMRRDATFLAEISAGHSNRPYCVIDAGWTPGTVCPGGPWTAGDPSRFPDMPGLAADMKRLGVRPGIWMRPTALMTVDDPARLRAGPCTSEEKPLDLTKAENLKLIHDDVKRVRDWGYDLIKHDFSTYDIFGKWGFEMGADLTDAGWSFADRSLTNAEIILQLYRTLREAAGDAVLLGCNTIGHLGAGIFEIQRAGDDTSGRVWERTRRMGINTLAFRLPQHGTFFAVDADCAAHTEATPWEFDRQFLDLVARSGTALFVSVDPATITADKKAAFSQAMQTALSGGTPGGCEPLDWLTTTTPTNWRLGAETVNYHWEEATGAIPFRV